MNDEVCQVLMRDFKPCGRQIYRDKKCIFHLDKKSEEEAQTFEIVFWKELERLEKDENTKELDFTSFIFPIPISFHSHLFEKPVSFSNVQFNEVDFSYTQFNDKAYFSSARFNNEAQFSYAQFNDKAIFLFAQFNDKAYFLIVKFNEAHFLDAQFNNRVDFSSAQFNVAYFIYTEFNDEVFFPFVQFNNETKFSGAKFDNKANFEDSEFQGTASFDNTKFPPSGEDLISFRNAKFHKPKDVRFQNIDLSNVSFLNTDVSEIEFLDEKWARKNGRLVVINETRIGKNSTTYDAVAQLYRRLRWNYETNYRFAEAGEFFIGEMEMRRRDVNTGYKNKTMRPIMLWFKRNLSLLGIYKYLSLYGESYKLPAVWALVVLGFYPILMHWLFNVSIPNDFLTYMRESAASFFQMDTKYIGERIIGIPILGLLFIALKRQFERKK